MHPASVAKTLTKSPLIFSSFESGRKKRPGAKFFSTERGELSLTGLSDKRCIRLVRELAPVQCTRGIMIAASISEAESA
jgi:predicted transcriptional regulator